VQSHFAEGEAVYAERCQTQYGVYRPIIGRVVEKLLGYGDLTRGCDRVRYDICRHEYLSASSSPGCCDRRAQPAKAEISGLRELV